MSTMGKKQLKGRAYEAPQTEVLYLEVEQVLATSGGTEEDTPSGSVENLNPTNGSWY